MNRYIHNNIPIAKIPNRLRLAKEISGHFRDVSKYIPSEHRNRPDPMTQIHNAYDIKIDTTEYMNNRNYFSTLYRSMRLADITHQDILSIYGNPYIGIVTKWGDLSTQRKQNLIKEYPKIDEEAEKIRRERDEFKRKLERMIDTPIDRFVDHVVIPMTTLAFSQSYYGKAYAVAKTVVLPRLGQIATAMGASELYRQYINFSKKNDTKGGLKKASESAKPRLGTSGFKDGKYWSGLTDNINGLKNLGVKSKDAQGMFGDYLKLKRLIKNGEIRMDQYGNFYKFDRAHQSAKIHLEKIVKKGNTFWNTAEVDAETGIVIKNISNRPLGK